MAQNVADKNKLARAEKIIGYTYNDTALLREALTHPSARKTFFGRNYERMEFLGDAILGAIIAAELYTRYPKATEGDLTKMRIALVAGDALSSVVEELGLSDCIFVGEAQSHDVRLKGKSLLEDVFEAIVASLYLDGGVGEARTFILDVFHERLNTAEEHADSPKSQLQELMQKRCHKNPTYKILGKSGSPHDPRFKAQVMLSARILARGSGESKKAAEQDAAARALALIQSGEINVP